MVPFVWFLFSLTYLILVWLRRVGENFIPELGVIIRRRSTATKYLEKDCPVISITPVIRNEASLETVLRGARSCRNHISLHLFFCSNGLPNSIAR